MHQQNTKCTREKSLVHCINIISLCHEYSHLRVAVFFGSIMNETIYGSFIFVSHAMHRQGAFCEKFCILHGFYKYRLSIFTISGYYKIK